MEDKGCKVRYEILSNERYGEELDKKLKQEVNEYLADYSTEEIAYVMEVIYAILEHFIIMVNKNMLVTLLPQYKKR